MNSKLKNAFTLIELLIVVAIIAILAAIAVPNFLEAQVRSKVARVRADQRTLATGIEAYGVDYNRNPLSDAEWSKAVTPPRWLGLYGLIALTTPVAYITTVPRDVFVDKGAWLPNNPQGLPYFRYESHNGAEKWTGAAGAKIDMQKALARGYYWSLNSFGPSKKGTKPTNNQWNTVYDMLAGNPGYGVWVYDPSNGTVSYGLIGRTNKGEMSGADFVGIY